MAAWWNGRLIRYGTAYVGMTWGTASFRGNEKKKKRMSPLCVRSTCMFGVVYKPMARLQGYRATARHESTRRAAELSRIITRGFGTPSHALHTSSSASHSTAPLQMSLIGDSLTIPVWSRVRGALCNSLGRPLKARNEPWRLVAVAGGFIEMAAERAVGSCTFAACGSRGSFQVQRMWHSEAVEIS